MPNIEDYDHLQSGDERAETGSAGDHDDSDGEGIIDPPMPDDDFTKLLVEWARTFERYEAATYQQNLATASDTDATHAQRAQEAADLARTAYQNATAATAKKKQLVIKIMFIFFIC